jgi:hypothetical protein
MSYQGKLAAFALLVGLLAPAWGEPSDAERQLIVKLMQETKIDAVFDATTADGFVADNDPDTLQIVFLDSPTAGPSHVSEDGEVIFLNNATDDEQQALIRQAFEIKARLRLAAGK